MTATVARDLDDADIVRIRMDRSNIEAGYTANVLTTLMSLSDSGERIRRLKGGVLIEVLGYDNDLRELYEVPEVCRFFQALTAQWPYWLWFIYREGSVSQLPLVLQLMCNSVAQDSDGGITRSGTPHWKVLQAMSQLARGLDALCVSEGIPGADFGAP